MGCSVSPNEGQAVATRTSQIINGSLTRAYPAVVGLALPEGTIFCTGTLIRPSVVLTAAHCVRGLPPSHVVVGPDDTSGKRIAVSRVYRVASWAPSRPEVDVGVVMLAEDAGVLPLEMGDLPSVGSRLTVVGFGLAGKGEDPTPRKREGKVIVRSNDEPAEIGTDPSLPCVGDSGGPVLREVGGLAQVVGIVSYGDESCASQAFVAWPKGMAWPVFLEPLLKRFDATALGLGERCERNASCATNLCSAPAATKAATCTKACVSDETCEGQGLRCIDGACRYTPLSGTLDGLCAFDFDCDTGLCADVPSRGQKICGTLCFAADGPTCGAGRSCLPDSKARSACVRTPQARAIGGCGISRADVSGEFLFVMVLTLLGVLARRRKLHVTQNR